MIKYFRSVTSNGSLLEEEYFYKREQELIAKLKAAEQERLETLEKASHVHRCSHCGDQMKEQSFESLNFLYCQACQSVHVTKQQLENLGQNHMFKKFSNYVSGLTKQLRQSSQSIIS
ncbi:MAG: hypothetical protein ACOH5I_03085 [Oligoflexus sp.]